MIEPKLPEQASPQRGRGWAVRLRTYAPPCLLTLLLGAGVVVYRGPGWRPLRAHGGDVLVVMFLYFLAAALVPGRPLRRAAAVLAFAVAVECFQLLGLVSPRDPQVLQILIGSTFDPWDLLAYAVGTGLALLADRGLNREAVS